MQKGLFAKSPFKREINPFTRIVAQWGLTGHRVISRLRSSLVASGVKRTSITEPGFPRSAVQDHARAVPHVWRSRCLESVADQLMPPTPIDDESVRAAINGTL